MSIRIVEDPNELAALFLPEKQLHIYPLADLAEAFWASTPLSPPCPSTPALLRSTMWNASIMWNIHRWPSAGYYSLERPQRNDAMRRQSFNEG
ncbi:MAG: hypothetical protein ACI81L_003668 [Verrucomicrobiales bacterium]